MNLVSRPLMKSLLWRSNDRFFLFMDRWFVLLTKNWSVTYISGDARIIVSSQEDFSCSEKKNEMASKLGESAFSFSRMHFIKSQVKVFQENQISSEHLLSSLIATVASGVRREKWQNGGETVLCATEEKKSQSRLNRFISRIPRVHISLFIIQTRRDESIYPCIILLVSFRR